ncbi:MAG TPA: transposase, partial [Nitrosomonas mobilis]|nr:transposase [Nitrosomonas mobilis]
MKPHSAIKLDLVADEHHRKKIESHIDLAALVMELDRVAPRPMSLQGGRPPYPTETVVRIFVLKRLHNLSDEQTEYQLLDRMSYQRFCGLANATNVPDRTTTVWTFENRIGETGAKALFYGVSAQLLQQGFIARGGQIIDATLVPVPRQHNSRGEKGLIKQGTMPTGWKPAKRRQKDTDATWTDRSYPSEEREAWLKENGFRNQTQRKGKRNKLLSECQQRRNKRIA